MSINDKICCWLSWNFFLRIFVALILLGIPLGFYRFEQITIYQLISGIGVAVGFYLLYQRNKIFEKQLIQKDELHNKDSQFKNFLEATKMLTDEKSTINAKVSALYLLYDVAKSHPENIDRIIQVINKQLTPLMRYLGNEKESKNHLILQSRCRPQTDSIKIDAYDNSIETIREWRNVGNDTEKLLSVSLDIIKKIILNNDFGNINHINLSNVVIFDIDLKYDKEFIEAQKKTFFANIGKPILNLIFLHCRFYHTDKNKGVDFSKSVFYGVKFIDSDLRNCNFYKSNLWGSAFIRCEIENCNFEEAECEGVEFKDCQNFTGKQADEMYFENKNIDKSKGYLFVFGEGEFNGKKCFDSFDEYRAWKKEVNRPNHD